jgi:hypothetical protein
MEEDPQAEKRKVNNVISGIFMAKLLKQRNMV